MCICKWFHQRIFVGCRDKSKHKNSTFGIIVSDFLVQLCSCTQKIACAMRIKERGKNWKRWIFSAYV